MSNKGQAGIGSLIIFIAMVLVATVAAAVLFQTSGVLQQKATNTGTEAIWGVSENIIVQTITGERNSTVDAELGTYCLTIKAGPGAGLIDLEQMIITAGNATEIIYLNHSENLSETTFTTAEIRDADNSYNNDNFVMNSGDLIKVTIGSEVGFNAAPRENIYFVLTPEQGNSVRIEFNTPNTYGNNTIVRLYPGDSISQDTKKPKKDKEDKDKDKEDKDKEDKDKEDKDKD